ncbi:MAG: hypothetical protein ACRDWV_10080 [Acidimicrobiales bacterium]
MIDQAPRRYAFSVREWHLIAEVGLLDEDSLVELIDGRHSRRTPLATRASSASTT